MSSKIQIGDTVYVWKNCYDFTEYQIKCTVTDILSLPKYGRGRERSFVCETEDGHKTGSLWQEHTNAGVGPVRRLIRKTPFKDIPVLENGEQIKEMVRGHDYAATRQAHQIA